MMISNEIINKIYGTGFVQDSQGKDYFALNSGIPYDEGMTIYNLIKQTRSQKTLEVGMAYGLSALYACQAHSENNIGGVHTAIDPAQREGFKSIGLLNIGRAGLDRHFRFFEANSYEILPILLAQGERFDFIFIDGMHVYDYVLVDFFFADLLLKPKGYIMFDDLWMPSIRPAVMYVLRNRHYQMDPHWIWNRKPLIRQFWDFIRTDKRRRFKIKIMLRHQLWRPLDISPAFFALKGSLRFQIFQKIAEDDRPWYYHREF